MKLGAEARTGCIIRGVSSSEPAGGVYHHPSLSLTPTQVMIREKNPSGFLSASEMPLFTLYMVMAACFLAAGIFWVSVLCRNT